MIQFLEGMILLLGLGVVGAYLLLPSSVHPKDGETLEEYLEREKSMKSFWNLK
jgi:hypothetical protein